MGITFVQKSDLSRPRPEARRALVLAGGAISGGAFKLGGLEAFNRYLTRTTVNDFDVHLGISAGAFIAAPIAAGVRPAELVDAIIGEPTQFTRFRMSDFYRPNWRELLSRPALLARDLITITPRAFGALLRSLPSALPQVRRRADDFIADPNVDTAKAVLIPLLDGLSQHAADRRRYGYLPSGLFDNASIERYVRHNLERNDLPNSFRQLKLRTGKSLYISATNINTAQGVVFGHDEDNSVTISEAVQASTAIPGFFKPARVGPPGRPQDYCDAGVRKTANISTAVRHGAELIVCYNPFRPFVNYRHRPVSGAHSSIADLGMGVIINQAFRTLLHSRLRLGIEKLKLDPSFRGDLILIEPTETDQRFFQMNPLNFWTSAAAAEHGFQSVKRSLAKYDRTLRRILGAYGIEVDLDAIGDQLTPPDDERAAPQTRAPAPPTPPAPAGRRPNLRVVGGGRE